MINYIEKGNGLHDVLSQAGYGATSNFGVSSAWRTDGQALTESDEIELQAIIDSYDPWPTEKANKLAEILSDSESYLHEAVMKFYPRFEVETWPYQKADAEAYALDNTASTPTIDAIVAARGVAKSVIAPKILEKAGQFNATAATFAGERQRLEDIIDAMNDTDNTLDDLRAVKFIPPVV